MCPDHPNCSYAKLKQCLSKSKETLSATRKLTCYRNRFTISQMATGCQLKTTGEQLKEERMNQKLKEIVDSNALKNLCYLALLVFPLVFENGAIIEV